MKKIVVFGALWLSSMVFAQIDFGVKGGLNFASVGDMDRYVSSAFSSKASSNMKTGYHLGVWGRVALPIVGIYVQPELNYTHLKTEYGNNADYKLDKIDIPVLAGLKILGIGRVFAGPSFQYLINDKLDINGVTDVSSDDFTVGIQLGAGVELGKLGIDLRYDRGLNKTESKFANNLGNTYVIDSRPSQVILGISYKLTD
ncbi:MAG: porin family protein [Flavobacteriales bacterium]